MYKVLFFFKVQAELFIPSHSHTSRLDFTQFEFTHIYLLHVLQKYLFSTCVIGNLLNDAYFFMLYAPKMNLDLFH